MAKKNSPESKGLKKIKDIPEVKSVTADMKKLKEKLVSLREKISVKNIKKEVEFIDTAEYVNEVKYAKLKNLLFHISELLFVVFLLAFFFHFFHFGIVSGNSMEPTYHNGDKWVSVTKNEYCQNDIVIFYHEEDSEKKAMVKRVIATEGDTVSLVDGDVYVNGELYDEAYTQGDTTGLEETTVGKNEVYVMGDNRENSYDSRSFGTVDYGDIIGKVVKIW